MKHSLALRIILAALVGITVSLPHLAGAVPVGNTHLGTQALNRNTGSNNTALGFKAMDPNAVCTARGTPNACCTSAGTGTCGNTGDDNTAVGQNALTRNTAGYSNTAAGSRALTADTNGADNTAVGVVALE